RCARFRCPPWRQHTDTTAEKEQTESTIVTKRRTQATPSDLMAARRVEPPACVRLHAERPPDLLTQVIGQRLPSRATHHLAGNLRFARAVVVDVARLRSATKCAHEIHGAVRS